MHTSMRICFSVLFVAAISVVSTAPAQDTGGGGGGGGGGTDTNATAGVAGVEIDAAGVLRTRYFRDPNGRLTKERLAQMKAALNPDVARSSKLRKVSLNRLENALAERLSAGAGVTDDMRNLAGLTQVQFVFFYPATRDIVIAGQAEGYGYDASGRAIGLTSGRAVLQLEDLVVVLRAFGPQSRATPVISCSIDPTSDGLQRMQQFLVNISGRVRPTDAKRIAQGLRESLGMQTVSIRGVSPRTHFAQVLVEADYRMKLIGIGREIPPVKITSYVKRARPSSVSRNALQRWYFVPDYESVKVSEDHFAMELVGEGVKLVGQNELVQLDGSRARSSAVDRASQTFVTSFTKKYAALARVSPVFAQLRNLINLAIAAAHIQHEDFYAQANWDLGVFGDEALYAVEIHKEPKQVESAVNVVWKGRTLMTPIGGGVNIQATQALSPDRITIDETGKLKEMQQELIDLSELGDRWWWD